MRGETDFQEILPVNIRRRQLLQLLTTGMLATVFPGCHENDRGLAPGDRFPTLALPYLESGKGMFLDSFPVSSIVNFWASWCEPCRSEMPDLEKLSRLFSPGELMVVGVTVDKEINLAREFSLQQKLTFTLLSDSNMALSNGILHIPAFPMTYLLRRDHTVADIIIGGRDWTGKSMIGEIERLLDVKIIKTVIRG
jgi:thiol-disulfide isomerase/thioredoxin